VLAPLDTAGLEERDGALAHAIYDAAVRHWISLERLLSGALKRPLDAIEPALRGVLLAGAAQILILERLPAHAVLNESVEAAKRLVRPGAAGIVNAALRRIAELCGDLEPKPDDWMERRDLLALGNGRVRRLTHAVLPDDAAERLSIVTSHPRWLLDRWKETRAEPTASDLAMHDLMASPTVLNTGHASLPLPETLAPHSWPGHHLFVGSHRALTELLRERRDLWVQDPASSAAVEAVGGLPVSLAVDLCAGRGTKTRQLVALFPAARIIATDLDASRFRILAELWRDHPRVAVLPMDEAVAEARGKADLVLLDVPCSNTGVLARRIEAKYRCGPAQLQRLASVQAQITGGAVDLLAPNGRILYSTCSIDPDENEKQVERACRRHALRIERQHLILPSGQPGDNVAAYSDGSFSSLIVRA
jgi:16S rRNA (cytosine967-C5)-methyltransferase